MTEPIKLPSAMQPPSNVPYLVAVVVMTLLMIVGILVISIMRPDKDNSIQITMIVGFTTTTTGAILAFMKSQETHLSVNSRLDGFIKQSSQIAHHEGHDEGVAAEQARVPVAAPTLTPVVATVEVATREGAVLKAGPVPLKHPKP